MHLIALFFIFFIFLLFIGLSLLGTLARIIARILSFFGLGKRSFYAGRQDAPGSEERNFSDTSYKPAKEPRGEKVFSADEGEYVDFEEIKEDDSASSASR